MMFNKPSDDTWENDPIDLSEWYQQPYDPEEIEPEHDDWWDWALDDPDEYE